MGSSTHSWVTDVAGYTVVNLAEAPVESYGSAGVPANVVSEESYY